MVFDKSNIFVFCEKEKIKKMISDRLKIKKYTRCT